MASQHADATLQSGLRGLRGFFLADPEDLSLIALVDELASTGQVGSTEPADDRVYRLPGGNDTLATAIANSLHTPVRLRHAVRRVTTTARGVVVAVEDGGAQLEDRGGLLRVGDASLDAARRPVHPGVARRSAARDCDAEVRAGDARAAPVQAPLLAPRDAAVRFREPTCRRARSGTPTRSSAGARAS